MSLPRAIRTQRLLLRRWCAADRASFAALNADPRVREHFPSLLTREQSDASVDRIERHFAEHGFGWWVIEVPGEVSFAGFVGLSVPSFDAHFTPCVEVGWRLAAAYWGRGYATEGARGALAFGFRQLGLADMVSFTVPGNHRSRRVMERIGMSHDPAGDFDRPIEGQAPWRHVLYRITRAEFERGMPASDVLPIAFS